MMLIIKAIFKCGQKEGSRYIVAYDLEDGLSEMREWLNRSVFSDNGVREIVSVEALNVKSGPIVTKRALEILVRDARQGK